MKQNNTTELLNISSPSIYHKNCQNMQHRTPKYVCPLFLAFPSHSPHLKSASAIFNMWGAVRGAGAPPHKSGGG